MAEKLTPHIILNKRAIGWLWNDYCQNRSHGGTFVKHS